MTPLGGGYSPFTPKPGASCRVVRPLGPVMYVISTAMDPLVMQPVFVCSPLGLVHRYFSPPFHSPLHLPPLAPLFTGRHLHELLCNVFRHEGDESADLVRVLLGGLNSGKDGLDSDADVFAACHLLNLPDCTT